MEKTKQEIKKIIEELLQVMGFEAVVNIAEDKNNTIEANIAVGEGGFLIGQGGENLFALQHIIRLMLFKEFGEAAKNFLLDVNGYRQGKIEMLKDIAMDRADLVVKERRSFSFEPMSSYERRVIHMVLGGRYDVICESEGEGAERHIVIKPA